MFQEETKFFFTWDKIYKDSAELTPYPAIARSSSYSLVEIWVTGQREWSKIIKQHGESIYLLPDQQSFLPRDRHYLVLP